MDLLRTLRLLRAYRWSLLGVAVTAVLASVAVSYSVPERYRATTLILVRPQEKMRLEARGSEKEILNYPVSALAPVDVPSRTYIEVIRSAALAERVVTSLGLDQPRPPSEQSYWRALWTRTTDRLVEVAGDLWLLLEYGEVKKRTPLDAATDRLQRNMTLASIKDTYLFQITYDGRTPEEAAAVANMLAEIFVDYLTTTEHSEANANRVFLEQRLQTTAETVTSARRDLQEFKDGQATFALQDEYKSGLTTMSKLRADLAQTEARLEGLLETHTMAHPDVQTLVAQRNRLRESIASLGSARRPLAEKEKQLGELQLRLTIAEGDYSVVSKALAEARVQEASEANEVRVVSAAQPPTYPVAPIKLIYPAAAGLAALLLGICAILLADSLWSRVRCIDDAQRLGLPVLATFPAITSRSNA
jgi:uncharacterized protein involved in exopolysaccharide biosynthesis